MEKISFNNNKSILREKTIKFYVSPSRKDLKSIAYYRTGGYHLKSYDSNPYVYSDRNFCMNDNAIIEAGYLLCRFSPQKFYELYTLILNDRVRHLLKESLTKIQDEYRKFAIEGQEGKIEYPEFSFWSGEYYCTTNENPLNVNSIEINLDNSHNLESCISQYRVEATNDFGYIHHFCTEPKYGRCYSSYLDKPINEETVHNFAQMLCQSDIEEYQKLLETINQHDPYYQTIINGGASYVADIKTLSRKLF